MRKQKNMSEAEMPIYYFRLPVGIDYFLRGCQPQ